MQMQDLDRETPALFAAAPSFASPLIADYGPDHHRLVPMRAR